MSDVVDAKFAVPFPLELIIGQTPLSVQSKIAKAKTSWKNTVGQCAKDKISEAREQCFLDDRPLQATIYYFPTTQMTGDIDNIVKLILDGMVGVAYRDDQSIERVVVQKFEPEISWRFPSPSSALQRAITMEKPALYIRLDDNLAWREVS
jgi:Holliday junction resolvase RusA-like endonuclease